MHKARAAAKTAKAMATQADRITELEAKVDRLLELVEALAKKNGIKIAVVMDQDQQEVVAEAVATTRKASKETANDDQ